MRRLYVVNSLKKLTVWLGSFVILIGISLLFNADVSRDIALLVVVVGLSIQVYSFMFCKESNEKPFLNGQLIRFFLNGINIRIRKKISIF